MRITTLTKTISRNNGGMFESVRHLCQMVQAADVDCEVLAIRDALSTEDIACWEPLHPRVVTGRGPSDFAVAPAMDQELQALSPDLLHVHGLWQYTSVCASRHHARHGTPYVVSPRGMLDRWALENSAWKKRVAARLFENRHLREAACIHALCDAEAASIREYGLTNPIAIIPNGATSVAPTSRDMEGPVTPAKPKQLLYLGRIHPKKGIDALLQAWSHVGAPDWHLTIAGWDDGGHEAALKAESTALGLDDSVTFAGPMFGDDKARILRSASAFILPSHSEGLPMSVLEAWSHALPVLMTPECHLPEGCTHAAAIEMQPTPESIEQAIRQLVELPDEERIGMGRRGLELTKDHFSWSRIANQMISVYKWCLHEAPLPDCVQLG